MKWGCMMYLHKDKELFKNIINATAVDLNRYYHDFKTIGKS